MTQKISVIIPFYNEPTVAQLIEKLYLVRFAENLSLEVIVVDDGSTHPLPQDSIEKMQSYPNLQWLKHEKNLGKGAAIKTGLKKSSGDVVIIQDGDLEYNPEDIPSVIEPIITGKTLVCYGSRHISIEQRHNNILWFKKHFRQTFLAFLGGRAITLLLNLLFWARLTDAATCYKAFNADFIKGLSLKEDGFEMETELTAKTLKATRIYEVPIHYYPRTRTEGKKITWKDGFRSLFSIFKYRFSN